MKVYFLECFSPSPPPCFIHETKLEMWETTVSTLIESVFERLGVSGRRNISRSPTSTTTSFLLMNFFFPTSLGIVFRCYEVVASHSRSYNIYRMFKNNKEVLLYSEKSISLSRYNINNEVYFLSLLSQVLIDSVSAMIDVLLLSKGHCYWLYYYTQPFNPYFFV